jgi:hypothetical protein
LLGPARLTALSSDSPVSQFWEVEHDFKACLNSHIEVRCIHQSALLRVHRPDLRCGSFFPGQDYTVERTKRGLPMIAFRLVGAQRVRNPKLEAAFDACCERLRKAGRADAELTIRTCFHGARASLSVRCAARERTRARRCFTCFPFDGCMCHANVGFHSFALFCRLDAAQSVPHLQPRAAARGPQEQPVSRR